MDNSIERANKDSVNVMFRGTQPLATGRNAFLRHALRSIGNNLSEHETNNIQTLNPRHSGAIRAFINGEWITTEYSYLSDTMTDTNEVEQLIIRQAKDWMDASDFTVVNVDTSYASGEKLALALASVTGGVIVDNWLDENNYSCRPTFPEKHEVGENTRIDLLTLPKGWSRIDAIALMNHIASEDAPPHVSLSVKNDASTRSTIVEFVQNVENRYKITRKFNVTGEKDVSISTYYNDDNARSLLRKVAHTVGGQYACCLNPYEDTMVNETLQFDVSNLGLETMPSLTSDRVKVVNAIMSANNLLSVLAPDDREQTQGMLDEVVGAVAAQDYRLLKSQRVLTTEKEAHVKSARGIGDR